jgi:hypothetical protein
MPLNGMIWLNHAPIIDWYVGRIERWDGPIPADSVNTYHWWVRRRDGSPEVEGELRHRYGDGAEALVAKVLAAAAEASN